MLKTDYVHCRLFVAQTMDGLRRLHEQIDAIANRYPGLDIECELCDDAESLSSFVAPSALALPKAEVYIGDRDNPEVHTVVKVALELPALCMNRTLKLAIKLLGHEKEGKVE